MKPTERRSSNEYIADLAAKWADHRFCTRSGRRFACVLGSDSILQRALTLGLFLTSREKELLEKHILTGAIVELGAIEPPMVYGDLDTLKSNWLELHRSFNAPLTEEESAAFNLWPNSDGNQEDCADSDPLAY